MRRSILYVCLLWLFCVLYVPASAAVADYIGKPVGSVRFVLEGRNVNDPIFAEIVETAVDRPLSMVQVRESIAQLFSLGRFEDVAVEATLDNGRVALLYVLTPVHPVSRIRFNFHTSVGIDSGELRRAIADRYGAAPPVGRTTDMVRILTDSLAERGYLHLGDRLHEGAGL